MVATMAIDLKNRLFPPPAELHEPLQTIRLESGERKLTRDLLVKIDDELIRVRAGFTTDFSSYPRMAFVIVLALLVGFYPLAWLLIFLLLLEPKFSRVDSAGVLHDYFYRHGGRSKGQADKAWYQLARMGKHRANFLQAFAGRWVGLGIGGWWAWCKHQKSRDADKNKRAGEKEYLSDRVCRKLRSMLGRV